MLSHRFVSIYLGTLICASLACAEIHLLESSNTRCSFRYVVDPPASQAADSVNAAGELLKWFDSGVISTTEFLQPVRVLFVAIPQGTAPQFQVHSIHTTTQKFGLPGRPEATPVEEDHVLDCGARMTGVQQWRGFQLARIEVVLQSGSRQLSLLLDELQISIDFRGTPMPEAAKDREVYTLKSVAVNGSIATRWWQLERPSSILDEGENTWPAYDLYKFVVTEAGLYEATGAWLLARGVNLIDQPVGSIKVFGNGGKLINKLPSQSTDDHLIENAVLIEDADSDGIFDQEDRVLFYGEGLKGFDYADDTHLMNWTHQSPYATENTYWIGVDPSSTNGLRMSSLPSANGGVQQSVTTGQFYLDQDVFIFEGGNLQTESGLVWYSTTIDPGQERLYSVFLEDATGGPGTLRVRTRNSNAAYRIDVYINDSLIVHGTSETFIAQVRQGILQSGNNTVRIVNASPSSLHHFNYIEIEFERLVSAPNGKAFVLAPENESGYFSYQVEGIGSDGYLLDITDPLHPRMRRGGSFADSSLASQRRHYFATRPDQIRTPVFRGNSAIDNSLDYDRLRDPAMEAGILIITYDDWYSALEPMIEFHRDYSEEPLKAVRVKISDIFDEFGWGNYDPVAIRNFVRYAYENWRGPSRNSEPPSYVLFVGVGDYDYRNIMDGTDRNWMPPWNDFWKCSDDFYVDFDDEAANLLDMMSGRWPVEDESEVEAIVDKTIQYAMTPLYGPWKNTATFVADDEWKSGSCNETSHTKGSESLINLVLPEYFTFRKLYEILYPFRTSTTTSLKPDATQDLIETINRGTLLINYSGHGNEHVWTDEQLFVMDRDFGLLDNPRRWPLFVAATCTWGGYDRPSQRCFPEVLLAHPSNGAVACVAATRFTYGGQNATLSQEFYESLFSPGVESRASFGEALRITKTLNPNNTLYHVLGNPVLRLATPEFFAHVSERDDSLQALSLFHLSGFVSKEAAHIELNSRLDNASRSVLDDDPAIWSDFQGVVEAQVFDTEDSAAYYWCGDTESQPYYYGLPGNAIFRGLATVTNGVFDVTFRVPRDIQYGGTNAKVSLYYYGKSDSEPDSADGIGIEQPLRIASAAATEIDSIPPQITIWMESSSFTTGDQVSRTPVLHVYLSDDSGINLSGSVGHRVTVRTDDAASEDLTPYFNYNLDSYTEGFLEKEIGPLAVGEHRLVIEAWDSFNNLNQAAVTFLVGEEGEAGYAIHDVYNWPNPMTSETYFTYSLTQQGTREVSLKIFTLTGKLVYEMQGLGTRQLYNSNSDRPWYGRDREGKELANGVYFYKIKAVHDQGHAAEATGKLVILR